MGYNDQLLIPPAVKSDPGSFEILRVWVANNDQHVSLRVGIWADPAAWGIMLADLMKHIVNSYEQDTASDRAATLQRVRAALNAELASSTDNPTGE